MIEKDNEMTINEKELVELLTDEIYRAKMIYICDIDGFNVADKVLLQWGFEEAYLEWEGGQNYFVVDSTSNDIFPGETISVNEILDIVL